MRRNRIEPTLVDYMGIAIGPALIMVLVSSVAFFLLTVFYAGAFEGVLKWTMTCFVVAAVLISRVSINEGAERATIFGAVLMIVVGLAMIKYTAQPWIAWIVLGVIWAFASHLVWNCTLIDDAEDASGEGLLEAAGLEGNDSAAGSAEESAAAQSKSPAARPKQFPSKQEKIAQAAPAPVPPPPLPAWRRMIAWWQRGSSRAAPPGIWVIYCSLVALPIFGVGQIFLERNDRAYGFQLMFRYVAAALMLLLTTSFLGLRRYLRQRRLEMPAKMAGAWLGVGGVMVAAILLLALLIPRPNPDYSVTALAGWLTSPAREASRRAFQKKSTGEGESKSTASADEKAKDEKSDQQQGGESDKTSPDAQGGPSGKSGEKGDPQQGEGKQQNGGESKSEQGKAEQGQSEQEKSERGKQSPSDSTQKQSAESPSGEQPQEQQRSKQNGDQQSEEQRKEEKEQEAQEQKAKEEKQEATRQGKNPPPATPSSSSMPSFQWLGTALKALLYLAVAIVLIYLLIRYWAEVRAWLGRLWQEVLDIWNSLFGGKRQQQETAEIAAAEEAAAQARPFASFRDPFASGEAARSKPSAVVQYSFEALEAWASERGLARQPEETPLEFAGRLASGGGLGAEASELGSLYARVAYARDPLSKNSLASVERLWKTLRRAGAAPTTQSAASKRG